MTSLKTILLSLALTTASMGVTAMPAMAATAARPGAARVDTAAQVAAQAATLEADIKAAINDLPAGSTVATIEAAINTAIGNDGFSATVVSAALRDVQTAYPSGSNAGLAVATLDTPSGDGSTPLAGLSSGQSGGSPIGSLVVGSSGGSATIP